MTEIYVSTLLHIQTPITSQLKDIVLCILVWQRPYTQAQLNGTCARVISIGMLYCLGNVCCKYMTVATTLGLCLDI